jgi:hypothetical protein
MGSKFAEFINKTEDSEMSSKQLDILIEEIRGLREDIKMVTESQGRYNAPQTQVSQTNPVSNSIVESQPQQAPAPQQTLFGMPVPDRSEVSVAPKEQIDMMAHASKILS